MVINTIILCQFIKTEKLKKEIVLKQDLLNKII